MATLLKIIIALIVFSIIILFHELGHFLLAKANKIKVNEFCLGLGPTLLSVQKGEQKYSLKLLPFGGACMMEGEDEESDDERSFNSKSVWARMSVVFAGPFFNFIMAFIAAFIIILLGGYDKPVLNDVIDGYAAQEAGLQGGDVLYAINGKRIHFYREISSYSFFHAGEEIEISYSRDGKIHTTVLVPKYNEESDSYLYGFIGGEIEKVNVLEAFVYGFYEVKYWIHTTIMSLRMMILGHFGINDLSGPVGIVQTMGNSLEESAKTSGIYYAFLNGLNWIILLSANLGVMNLLPLPALDGGRLFFMIVEVIRGKKVDAQKEGYVHFIGIILLLLLMCVVMANDIRKLF